MKCFFLKIMILMGLQMLPACSDGGLPLKQQGEQAQNSPSKNNLDHVTVIPQAIDSVEESGQVEVTDAPQTYSEQALSATPQPEQMASEPVLVGGAYLSCSIDRQITSQELGGSLTANDLPLGCSLFQGEKLGMRIADAGYTIQKAALITPNERRELTIVKAAPAHRRWSWLSKIQVGEGSRELRVDVESNAILTKNLKIILRESIPGSLVVGTDLSQGSYSLFAEEKGECLRASPNWNLPAGASETVAEAAHLGACDTAPRFKWLAWMGGYRIHQFNDKRIVACLANTYDQALCDRSCLDLKNFGTGNRFEMNGCTFSVEAQAAMISLSPVQAGGMRLRFNNRTMGIKADKTFGPTDLDALNIDISLISYP